MVGGITVPVVSVDMVLVLLVLEKEDDASADMAEKRAGLMGALGWLWRLQAEACVVSSTNVDL